MSSECPHGHQALVGYLLPVNLAAGAAFQPELLYEAGKVCGRQLRELGVDIAVCKPGLLEIILIDVAERLDKESRERLYAKCKAKGLQLLATRVTDSEELEVTEL